MSACSRVYVQKNVKELLIKRLVEKTRNLSIGNPLVPNAFMGPLINSNAYKNYQKFAKIASRDGRIIIGGTVKRSGDFKYGYYVEPTIVDDLPKGHMLFKEELFVPILCVAKYKHFDEALQLCNESEYGLTSGIYSTKKEEIHSFLENAKAGVIYVNRARQCHNRSNGGFSAVWWLERFWHDGQRNRRALLLASISQRAEPDCCYLTDTIWK